MATKKVTGAKKPLTLHKHYLVDVRRFAKDLGLTDDDWGKALDCKMITRNKKRYLAIRVDE